MVSTGNQLISIAHEQAWNFFKQHAEQRMSLFRFFLIFLAAFLVAMAAAAEQDDQFFILVLFFVLLFTTLIFWSLERRTVVLLKVSERALIKIQASLASELDYPEIKMIEESDKKKKNRGSYKKTFTVFYAVITVVSIYGLIYAFCFYKFT